MWDFYLGTLWVWEGFNCILISFDWWKEGVNTFFFFSFFPPLSLTLSERRVLPVSLGGGNADVPTSTVQLRSLFSRHLFSKVPNVKQMISFL